MFLLDGKDFPEQWRFLSFHLSLLPSFLSNSIASDILVQERTVWVSPGTHLPNRVTAQESILEKWSFRKCPPDGRAEWTEVLVSPLLPIPQWCTRDCEAMRKIIKSTILFWAQLFSWGHSGSQVLAFSEDLQRDTFKVNFKCRKATWSEEFNL